jgi:hypothetical protein
MTPPRVTGEQRAWMALAANLLALPGLGSLLTGSLVAGLAQCALSLTGFAMTIVWLVRVVALMHAAGTLFLDPPPDLRLGLAGIALFGVAWLWAGAASWAHLRRVRPQAPPGAPR